MEIVKLSPEYVPVISQKASEILAADGVILYPTDTLYGLGADALSDDAVAKIYAIKGRDEKKPIHCIVYDLAMAEQYAEVNDLARMIAEEFWPGALTLVLKKKQGINTGIARNMSTIGIRIPDHAFCLALAEAFGRPITTTSANKSGATPESSIPKILAQLGSVALSIDLLIDEGVKPADLPSTVVDVTGTESIILREGAIPRKDIEDVVPIVLYP